MSEITLRNVCKLYDNKYYAVKDVNLDIHDKEFVIFVGPSGCGKSTALRMIAGLEEEVFLENIAEYPQFQTAIDQLHDSAPEYAGALLSVFPEARATVEAEIESMLNGKEVKDAVQDMAASINEAIEEYNLVNN